MAAFKAIIEYMYGGDYVKRAPGKPEGSSIAGLHTEVFLMASRLCMPDLEALVLNHISKAMVQRSGITTNKFWSYGNFFQMVNISYTYTPSTEVPTITKKLGVEQERVSAEDPGDTLVISQNSAAPDPPAALPRKPLRNSDKLRTFLAQYCASNISMYRKDPGFEELMRKHPDFAENLILAVNEGHAVKEIPIEPGVAG